MISLPVISVAGWPYEGHNDATRDALERVIDPRTRCFRLKPMPRPARQLPRTTSLRASRKDPGPGRRPGSSVGLFSVGFSMFLDEARTLVSDMQFTWGERRIMGIVGSVVPGRASAWRAGSRQADLDRGRLIDVFVDQAEAAARTADLIELHAVPTLGRIALALEKLNRRARGPRPVPRTTRPERRTSRGARSHRRLDGPRPRSSSAFIRDHPGPEAARLMAELTTPGTGPSRPLRARLEAARKTSKDALARDRASRRPDRASPRGPPRRPRPGPGPLAGRRDQARRSAPGRSGPEVANLASSGRRQLRRHPRRGFAPGLDPQPPPIRRPLPRCARPIGDRRRDLPALPVRPTGSHRAPLIPLSSGEPDFEESP